MGIDGARFRELARSPLTETERESLRGVLGGGKTILSIDRLDYTKGVIHRLCAFAELLKRCPEWLERVTLALIVVPSRVRVGEYRATKRAIEQLVGEINGRFSTSQWTPIFYRYRNLTPPELSALYRAGDVAFITPLRDGMNLVAKEYVASRIEDPGVLILSGGAGAAHDLSAALSVDPLDIEGMVGALTTALTMDRAERESRHRVMAEQIRSYSVHEWGRDFLAELSADSVAGPIEGLLPVARALVPRLRRAGRRLIFLDYDGTLRPFEVDPNAARPDRELMALLERLTSSPGATVVIVSGRSRESLERWFGHLPVGLIAEHGGEVRRIDGEWLPHREVSEAWKKTVRPYLERCVIATPGSFIEEKRFSLVWHYRGACGPGDASLRADHKARELVDFLLTFLDYSNLRVLPANKAVEVQLGGFDKGAAAWRFIEADRYEFIAAFGDDFTDEELFGALPPESAAVRVGGGASRAGYRLRDPAEVRLLLADCVAAEVDGDDTSYFVPNNRSPASPSPGTI
jgi:trehalose 6-phosphate synthase/phosphatase